MIVIADTSPINYLVLIGRIEVLQALYQRILVPYAVHDELIRSKAPLQVRAWALNPPGWVEMLSPSITPAILLDKLDPGEAEVISLAQELQADWLLIDESAGRDEATRRGIQTIGTLGILRDAHRTGLLDLETELAKLRDAGFYIAKPLIEALLQSVKET